MRKLTINIFLNQTNTCKLKSIDECEKEKIIIKNLASIELEDWEKDLMKGKKND